MHSPKPGQGRPLNTSYAGEADSDLLPAYVLHTETTYQHSHSVYLSGFIGDSLEYADLFIALRSAGPADQFLFYLNTPGGSLDTGLQLIHSVQASEARVTMILDPQASSMGALLFLCGDDVSVPPYSSLMFHNYSAELGMRKGHEQFAAVRAFTDTYRKVLERVCQPFLTFDEISGIQKGQDLWLDSDEILRRFAKLNKQSSSTQKAKPARLARLADSPTKGEQNAD